MMEIKIYSDQEVIINNKSSQNFENHVKVVFKNKLPEVLYTVSINHDPYQEIINGYVALPEFTKHDKNVIIRVRITQMGNVLKTITSEEYPVRWLPIIGSVLEEAFPITLQNLLDRQDDFENRVIKTLNRFQEIVDRVENEGEII